MKQYFAHYMKWEDYKNGMYNIDVENQNEKILLAQNLLCDIKEFKNIAERVIKEWPIATRVNLTNLSCNRRAWIGQASCNYKYKIPEILTRQAWKNLTNKQKDAANNIADICIRNYENILMNGKGGVISTAFQMKLPLDWNN